MVMVIVSTVKPFCVHTDEPCMQHCAVLKNKLSLCAWRSIKKISVYDYFSNIKILCCPFLYCLKCCVCLCHSCLLFSLLYIIFYNLICKASKVLSNMLRRGKYMAYCDKTLQAKYPWQSVRDVVQRFYGADFCEAIHVL